MLISSFLKPFYCFNKILRHTQAPEVTHAQFRLSSGIILFSSFTIPLYCLNIIRLHPLTDTVASAQMALSLGIAFFSFGFCVLELFWGGISLLRTQLPSRANAKQTANN